MINKDMTIGDIISKFPQTISVFKKFGLDCNECQIAQFEAVEGGADVHHVDVDELLSELNQVIEQN